uniref:Akirin n=2 Tax=Plectus sambesii TaxID=2011161 RepID=A0A914WMX0_9BILA
MACGVAVKRPHEYDVFLSPEVGGKRPRTNAHCSPFRPTFGTVAASLPSPSTSANSLSPQRNTGDSKQPAGPFSSVTGAKLSSEQLETYLRAEVSYLKRRKLIPRRRGDQPSSGYRAPGSPNQSSDSDEDNGSSVLTNTASKPVNAHADLYDRAQFSLKQVQLICERLLKEQEMRLRYEYETVLNQRLEEQHDQYVRFTQDQIERRFDNSDDISYLS